jgi:hypothetical protein
MPRRLPLVSIALLLCLPACRRSPEAEPAASKDEPPKPATREQPSSAAPGEDIDQLRAEARALTDRFRSQLESELLGVIEAEGGSPAKAIAVCQVEAPKIAASMSEDGWTVGRTAPRVRNPDNAPNEWQRRGLAHFAEAIAQAGENPDIAALEWHEIEEGPRGQRLLYMRAIPMGGLCLACHGPIDQLDETVREQLAALYPKDEATGFAVGELRGAFVVTKQL